MVTATKSTTLTVGVGTRSEKPSKRPFSSGITSASARAAPVPVGMMFCPALRARRRSLWTTSSTFWSLVYEWTVVISPCSMPKQSQITLAGSASPLVVHEALLMMWCCSGS